jgi:hypothetical protein
MLGHLLRDEALAQLRFRYAAADYTLCMNSYSLHAYLLTIAVCSVYTHQHVLTVRYSCG